MTGSYFPVWKDFLRRADVLAKEIAELGFLGFEALKTPLGLLSLITDLLSFVTDFEQLNV